MKIKLSILILILSFFLSLLSCGEKNDATPPNTEVLASDKVRLSETEDLGMSYIDSFIFIGESTTYHLKNRGILSGGQNTKQIWMPKGGTMTLDLTVDQIKIVYPETGEEMTFFEAAKRKQPQYVLMTFGLNGAVQNIKRGEKYFSDCYKKLISSIKNAAPDTKIILASAFPVAENMDMSAYSINLTTLNEYIDTINEWTYSIASEENCRYLDISKILKDENNNLKLEYQSGDGYHLTTEAYKKIIYYIRTHGYT